MLPLLITLGCTCTCVACVYVSCACNVLYPHFRSSFAHTHTHLSQYFNTHMYGRPSLKRDYKYTHDVVISQVYLFPKLWRDFHSIWSPQISLYTSTCVYTCMSPTVPMLPLWRNFTPIWSLKDFSTPQYYIYIHTFSREPAPLL